MLNAEQLVQLEEYGRCQFSFVECAKILNQDFDIFVNQVSNPATAEFRAYEKGRLLASAEIRKAILAQAKQGSSPAQKQMMDLIDATQKQNLQQRTESQRPLAVFRSTDAAAGYDDADSGGLFAVVGEYLDDDQERRFRIARVTGISGHVAHEKKIVDVYDDDINFLINKK